MSAILNLPKISVIIPTFNRAHFLEEALDSVFGQTFQDYEVIVVDDGSTDPTREIVAPYARRVRYVYQQNQGRSGARNTGLKLACGELIAFLDSDDRWISDKLERQTRYLRERSEVSFLHGHVEMIGDDGRLRETPTARTRALWSQAHRRGETYANWAMECRCFLSTVMVRADCIKEAGGFDPEIQANEELDLYLRIAAKHKIDFLEGDPLACYRVHADNSGHENLARGGVLVAQKHIASINSSSHFANRSQALRNLYLFLAQCHFMLAENPQGRAAFLKAWLQAGSLFKVLLERDVLRLWPHVRLFLASFLPNFARTTLKSRRNLRAEAS